MLAFGVGWRWLGPLAALAAVLLRPVSD